MAGERWVLACWRHSLLSLWVIRSKLWGAQKWLDSRLDSRCPPSDHAGSCALCPVRTKLAAFFSGEGKVILAGGEPGSFYWFPLLFLGDGSPLASATGDLEVVSELRLSHLS